MYIGDGKSHHILNRLRMTCSAYITIPMHEGFSYQQVIERLRSLPLNSGTMAKPAIYGVFFNFTMCYQKVTWVCGIIYMALIMRYCNFFRIQWIIWYMTNYLIWLAGSSLSCWFLELSWIINQLLHFDSMIKQCGTSTLRCEQFHWQKCSRQMQIPNNRCSAYSM